MYISGLSSVAHDNDFGLRRFHFAGTDFRAIIKREDGPSEAYARHHVITAFVFNANLLLRFFTTKVFSNF